MRLSLTPRTSEFFVLFARAGENALEVARLVERRFREHPNSGITQEQVKAAETAGDGITRPHRARDEALRPADRLIVAAAEQISVACDNLERFGAASRRRSSSRSGSRTRATASSLDGLIALCRDDRIDPLTVIR